jgi:hypothetical protein
MTCNQVEPELIAFHFGLVADGVREHVEGHLLSCPACLGKFLDRKRTIETCDDGPPPSAALRARVRQAVAVELGIGRRAYVWSWWERPLAFAFAGVAVWLALFAVHTLASGPGMRPHRLSEGDDPGWSRP